MLTETEAKTKWCPLVRFHGAPSDDCIPNRSGSFEDATRCIGSACMAWRWRHKAFFSVSWPGGTDGAYMHREGQAFGSVKIDEHRSLHAYAPQKNDVFGYCGAFGKPE